MDASYVCGVYATGGDFCKAAAARLRDELGLYIQSYAEVKKYM
jgi:hypothetical protein